MERDCMISQGSSHFLREKLFVDSDYYKMNVCGKCGLTAIKKKGGYDCKTCKNSSSIKEVPIPYASKLLFQELMAMNIAPRLMLDEIKEN
jgi:DNA-directed RNA polymerase II subunit RPB2